MAVNPGYVVESAVVPGDLDYIWGLIKSMKFKFSKAVVESSREEGNEDGSLGQYSIAYSDNTVQNVRVTEVSERLPTKRSLGMEMVDSDPPVDYSARMDEIILSAVTHGKRSVFVEFSSDFSSDVSMAALEDSKFKKREFFDDLIAFSESSAKS
eukprot:TRINITY_DN37729_c0_g1_i1.p1 TRINITY_DN37729_c0_g1~~TRINITY_DN37729_c0_g1_i1.p1  ORF type:complete len:154 (-),score=29.60 TRINITY_DN37729_c0_g1_i1:93-554(-)